MESVSSSPTKDNSWHSESDECSFQEALSKGENVDKDTFRRKVMNATLLPYRLAWKGFSWSTYPVRKVLGWRKDQYSQQKTRNNLDEADHLFAELVPRPPEDVYEAQRQSAVDRWLFGQSAYKCGTVESALEDNHSSSMEGKDDTRKVALVSSFSKFCGYSPLLLFLNWWRNRNNRHAIYELYKVLNNASTYMEWYNSAQLLDRLEGNDEWKHHDIEENDIRRLVFVVRAGLQRRFAGLCHPDLHKYSHVGTKSVVEDYVHVIAWLLEYLSTVDFANVSETVETKEISEGEFRHSPSNPLLDSIRKGFPTDERNQKKKEEVALQQKNFQFFNEMRHSYGRTALLLSGGAKMGLYHLGVAKALLDQRLLPRVISGSSAGAIIASFIGIFRDEELRILLNTLVNPRTKEKIRLEFFDNGVSLKRRLKRLWKKGILYDIRHLTSCMRNNLGDITFAEAYECTRRIINITVAPIRGTESILLNYLTAPNVLIWSAVGASCALPVIFSPVQLVAKDSDGQLVPYYLEGVKWMDGSINADVPLQRIGELFNVNHFIVSQTNPHVIPRGSRLMKSRFAKMIKAELKFRYWQLNELGLVPWIVSSIFPVLTQPFEGDVTIMPGLGLSDIIHLFSNPTEEEIQEYIRLGEYYTFPKIDVVRHHTLIELTLDACVERVGKQLFDLSFSSSHRSGGDSRTGWTRRAPSWLWLDTFLSPNSTISTPSQTPRLSHHSSFVRNNSQLERQLSKKREGKSTSSSFTISRENSVEFEENDQHH
ncbi:Triacylglycerol lipase SDP1L [Galdieria sulphuraria]|nr:Triacylglycerol lipase SDP1L [Galdieria sulphuraria]